MIQGYNAKGILFETLLVIFDNFKFFKPTHVLSNNLLNISLTISPLKIMFGNYCVCF